MLKGLHDQGLYVPIPIGVDPAVDEPPGVSRTEVEVCGVEDFDKMPFDEIDNHRDQEFDMADYDHLTSSLSELSSGDFLSDNQSSLDGNLSNEGLSFSEDEHNHTSSDGDGEDFNDFEDDEDDSCDNAYEDEADEYDSGFEDEQCDMYQAREDKEDDDIGIGKIDDTTTNFQDLKGTHRTHGCCAAPLKECHEREYPDMGQGDHQIKCLEDFTDPQHNFKVDLEEEQASNSSDYWKPSIMVESL